MNRRGFWSTRFGFYLATIGASFGLGNLWRFPYVLGENGGGAFVVLYLLCALVFGLPLLIAEMTLGRLVRKSQLAAVVDLGKSRKWALVSWISIGACLLTLSYYSVISGWVLHFSARYLVTLASGDPSVVRESLPVLMSSGLLQMALALAHILITSVIVEKGVREGLERWTSVIMPVFLVLVSIVLYQALQLPSSWEALRFLLYPDFSKLTTFSFGQALGHVFFTMSLGFGVMVTFGSYLRDDVHLPTVGFRVLIVDILGSLIAAVLIFAIVFGSGSAPTAGPLLLFETLPMLFSRIGWGPFLGLLFFICLYMAALGASIGLMEAAVSGLVDRFGISRVGATVRMGLGILGLSIFPALSSTALGGLSIFGFSGLAFVDQLVISWILPLSALVMAIFFMRHVPSRTRQDLFRDEVHPASVQMLGPWEFVLRWLLPLAILTALLIQVLALISA